MTPSGWNVRDFRDAARRLALYPRDEGWRQLYWLFMEELADPETLTARTLLRHVRDRPSGDPAHDLSVLGFALKQCAPEALAQLALITTGDGRGRQVLNAALERHGDQIQLTLAQRRNSFTCARRFLLAQVVFSGYFGAVGTSARFLDVGTGLGLLPRQLNSPSAYRAFAPDLRWPQRQPSYSRIPLRARFGIDRAPLPDLEWVRCCHGDSAYYQHLFSEVIWSLELPEVTGANAIVEPLDLGDTDRLAAFVREHQINAVNCSYVLYELSREQRNATVAALLANMVAPGLLLVVEPDVRIGYRGLVTAYVRETNSRGRCLVLGELTNRHCMGDIRPGPGFEAFGRAYRPDLLEET